jgi:biotin carboxylase
VPRIWFNHTYSTNSHVIAMLRDNPEGRPLYVIGTHPDLDSPVMTACDEVHREPVLGPADYVGWALEFARTHRVEVLVPRLYMAELADARAQFAAVGTTLMCADGAVVRLLADKPAAYRAARELGVPVPPHVVVRDGVGLRAAHEQLSEIADVICMKPVRGTGGAGFRIVSTDRPNLSDYTGQVRPKVNLAAVSTALDEAAGDRAPRWLVMPFLTGPEISVDVVATPAGEMLAAVGRGRSARRRRILDDVPAREVANVLTGALRIGYLSNTQVRYWQGPDDAIALPYLLEVNTRISGGLFQTTLAGVNLPWAALRLALGEQIEPITAKFGAAFTTVASLVVLD